MIQRCMTNTEFIRREKNGDHHFAFAPSRKVGSSRFGALDTALVVGFMAAFVGLIFLLAK